MSEVDSRNKRSNAGLKAADHEVLSSVRFEALQKWFIVQFDEDSTYATFNAADPNWEEHYTSMNFKRVGDSCKRKYQDGNKTKWWTGQIKWIGPKEKMDRKLQDYEAQLEHTKNPTLQQSFVEDLVSQQGGDHSDSSESDESFTPVLVKKTKPAQKSRKRPNEVGGTVATHSVVEEHPVPEKIRVADKENRAPSALACAQYSSGSRTLGRVGLLNESFTLSPILAANASTPAQQPLAYEAGTSHTTTNIVPEVPVVNKAAPVKDLMVKLLEAVEENASSNRAMRVSLDKFSSVVSTYTQAVERTQQNFVKEYSNFRREVRELKEVVRHGSAMSTTSIDMENVSNEPIMHNGVDLVKTNMRHTKPGPFGRSVARTLFTNDEIMFQMPVPKGTQGRAAMSPSRLEKLRKAVEQRFPGTGGCAFDDARSSISSMGNEKRDQKKKDELVEANKFLEEADELDRTGNEDEASRLRRRARDARKNIDLKYNIKARLGGSESRVETSGSENTSSFFSEN